MKYFRSRVVKTPFIVRQLTDVTAEYFNVRTLKWIRDDEISIEVDYSGDWYGVSEAVALETIRELRLLSA